MGGRRFIPDVGGDFYATDEIASCEEVLHMIVYLGNSRSFIDMLNINPGQK